MMVDSDMNPITINYYIVEIYAHVIMRMVFLMIYASPRVITITMKLLLTLLIH